MCCVIPFLIGAIISALLLNCYRKQLRQYEASVHSLTQETTVLKRELDAAQQKLALNAQQRDASAGYDENRFHSAVFDDSMANLIQIEKEAKASTLDAIEMAPAESAELSKLKAEIKAKQRRTAATAAALTASAAAMTAVKRNAEPHSDFIQRVLGSDQAMIKQHAQSNNPVSDTQKKVVISSQASAVVKPASDDQSSNYLLPLEGSENTSSDAATASKSVSLQQAQPLGNTDDAVQDNVRNTQQDNQPTGLNTATIAAAFLTSETFDKQAAKDAIGKSVKFDDLTVVEGIGPKIAGLFKDADITTWRALAETTVSRCQEILDAAGSRYRVHSPDTWPDQAKLAAQGEWEALNELQDQLQGGRKA